MAIVMEAWRKTRCGSIKAVMNFVIADSANI